MFSIIIPTLNNLKYLKICLNSIEKNSKYKHEIIPHINIGNDGTKEYLKSKNINFSFTNYNSGICKGMNLAAKLSTKDYILYAHDDFYFCPEWDEILKKEIDLIGHNNFYLSGTMMNNGQIEFNCGDSYNNFDEVNFLNNYKNHNFFDFQGSTWAPHLIHKDIWNQVTDLNLQDMKDTLDNNKDDWSESYTTVANNSGSWGNAANEIEINSDNWTTTYETVNASKSNWDTAYVASTDGFQAIAEAMEMIETSPWFTLYTGGSAQSVYTTVNMNSASW